MSTVDEITSLGYWIRRRRKVLDLTQEALAQQVGCAVATIKKIEADARRPSRQMAERIADCLRLPSEERATFLRVARAEVALHRMATPPRIEDVTHLPPVTAARRPHNLPVPANRLVGRTREVQQLHSLLQHAAPGEHPRLVTLTGPGGIGKTRLALQVVYEFVTATPAEIWFVALAPIQEAALVIPAIAQTLGVSAPANQSLLDSLKHYLHQRQTLLLLDNFEQVLDAAAQISELLASSPGLKVLVTSRAALHLSGEHEFSVPPLSLPDQIANVDLATLAQCESVQLLLERAQASGAKLSLTPENAVDVANICRRLEGLPLALELAAARCKLFAPPELLTRLEHRLRVLTAGTRDQPHRQQTLRATLDWSYQLLRTNEQILFARLGVFVGSFTLEAVEAVCHLPDDSPLDVIDGISVLLDQSLLRQSEEAAGERRFTMLETIREYADEKLMARGEEDGMCNQHAFYFLRLAEQARLPLFSAQQQVWYQRLILEQSNFRAALHWWRKNNDYTQVARLSAALGWFWWKHGDIREEVHWSEWALTEIASSSATTPVAVRAKALFGVATSISWLGDFVRARGLLEEYLQMEAEPGAFLDFYVALSSLAGITEFEGGFQQAVILNERRLAFSYANAFSTGIADSLMELGYLALLQGDAERASQLLQESLTLRKEVGSITGVASTQAMLGMVAREQGNFAQAWLLLHQSLELFRTLDDKQGIGWTFTELGVVAQLQHAFESAYHYQHNALMLERELGFQWVIALVLVRLGNLSLEKNDWELAHPYYIESLTICQRIHQKKSIASGLEGLAGVAARRERASQAAHLLGAAAACRQTIGIARSLDERDNYERTIAITRAALGDIVFDAAIAKGRATALTDVVAEALESPNDLPIP